MDNSIGIIGLISGKYVVLGDMNRISHIPFFLLPSDKVEYIVLNGKIHITKLIQRNTQYIVGVVQSVDHISNMYTIYCPNYPTVCQPIINYSGNDCKINSMVMLRVDMNSINIHRIYGNISDRKIDCMVALDSYHLNSTMIKPIYIMNQNNAMYTKEWQDLTHLDTFNVDPTNSKDFDDAISIIKDITDNYKIYIHIVDICSMMPNEMECHSIECNALKQAFTLYLPEHIENILPKEMAEWDFSLVKGEKRRVITFEFNINSKNQIVDSYDIYPSTIIIKNRYDYKQFNHLLEKGEYKELVDFYNVWKKVSYNVPRLYMNIDSSGNIASHWLESNIDIAHKIIETLMILTNMTVSKAMKSPQRFHKKLKAESVDTIQELCSNPIINNIMKIKKFSVATYDASNAGHFGLGIDSYTHFTSPIRRYFDVICHNMLAGYTLENMDEILEYINSREHTIDKITRFYENCKILSLLEKTKEPIVCYVINIVTKGIVIIMENLLYELYIPTVQSTYNVGDMVKIIIEGVLWSRMEVKSRIL
jgi:exoribonuclease R